MSLLDRERPSGVGESHRVTASQVDPVIILSAQKCAPARSRSPGRIASHQGHRNHKRDIGL